MADVADVQEDGGSDMAGFFKMMRGKNLESVVNEAAYVQRILEEQARRHSDREKALPQRTRGSDDRP